MYIGLVALQNPASHSKPCASKSLATITQEKKANVSVTKKKDQMMKDNKTKVNDVQKTMTRSQSRINQIIEDFFSECT